MVEKERDVEEEVEPAAREQQYQGNGQVNSILREYQLQGGRRDTPRWPRYAVSFVNVLIQTSDNAGYVCVQSCHLTRLRF